MRIMPTTEAAVPFQVQRDALEEMPQFENAIAAAPHHLQLVVRPFHKAAGLPRSEVVGDPKEPAIQQREEASEASQSTGFDLLAPLLDLPNAPCFGARGLEDQRERLAQIVGLLQRGRLLKQSRQALAFVRLQ